MKGKTEPVAERPTGLSATQGLTQHTIHHELFHIEIGEEIVLFSEDVPEDRELEGEFEGNPQIHEFREDAAAKFGEKFEEQLELGAEVDLQFRFVCCVFTLRPGSGLFCQFS